MQHAAHVTSTDSHNPMSLKRLKFTHRNSLSIATSSKMNCIHCGVPIKSKEQTKCLCCRRNPYDSSDRTENEKATLSKSTNDRDSDIEIYDTAPHHIAFDSNRNRQTSSTHTPVNRSTTINRKIYDEIQGRRQKAISHDASVKKSNSTSQFSINRVEPVQVHRWFEIWSIEGVSSPFKPPNCIEFIPLLPSQSISDWNAWIWDLAESVEGWIYYCRTNNYIRDYDRNARFGRLTNKTPGILRTDNWSHLKNLLDAFNNESQHILLILQIIDVSSTIDEPFNSIIKS